MNLSHLPTLALGTALIFAATAQAPAPGAMASEHKKPLQIHIKAQNNSGETGTATLLDGSKGLIVHVRLAGGPEGVAQPAHIHKGTCEKLDPKPAYPLSSVTGGKSQTTIPNLTLAQLAKGDYAINVHKSTSDIATYVACGNFEKNS